MLGPPRERDKGLLSLYAGECIDFADDLLDSVKPYNDIHVNNWKNPPIVILGK